MNNKYNNLSKEELISLIQRRDASRPLGLVWERNEFEHEKAINNDFVTLKLKSELSVGEGPFDNFIIEGDNFDALRYLRMTHKGKIKVIFIDPPYNTGNKDFIYNDSYVNVEDDFRHSKWIEFMYRRLIIARDLLTEDGVILINIGEDELAYLTLLMEKVFPGGKVANFVWRKRVGASDEAGFNVSMDHDYIVCYANKDFSFRGSEKDLNKYSNPDNDPRGPWMSADLSKGHNMTQRPNTYYPIRNPETDYWYPCSPSNVWRFSKKDRIKKGQKLRSLPMEDQIENGKVIFPNDGYVLYQTLEDLLNGIRNGEAPDVLTEDVPDLEFFVNKKIGYGRPRYKRHLSEMKSSTKPLSTFIANFKDKVPSDAESEYIKSGLNTEGTTLLKNILGSKDFDYPKPLSLVKNLLDQITSPDENHIILDFFAGSGTTAHAVLTLNDEDEGNRKFILVSNEESTSEDPEKNVCRDITKVRMQRVIEGYQYRNRKKLYKVDGLEGNFAYLNINKIKSEKVNIEIGHEEVWIALQMIHQFPVNGYLTDASIQQTYLNETVLIYISEINEHSFVELKRLMKTYANIVIYSWEPGMIRQKILNENVSINKIPDFLVNRFGG